MSSELKIFATWSLKLFLGLIYTIFILYNIIYNSFRVFSPLVTSNWKHVTQGREKCGGGGRPENRILVCTVAPSSTLGAFPGGAAAAAGASSWGQAGLGLWIFAAGTLLSRACFPKCDR